MKCLFVDQQYQSRWRRSVIPGEDGLTSESSVCGLLVVTQDCQRVSRGLDQAGYNRMLPADQHCCIGFYLGPVEPEWHRVAIFIQVLPQADEGATRFQVVVHGHNE